MHSLIIGMTQSGKTTLAISLAKTLKAKGKKLAALDHFPSKKWGADYCTDSAASLVAYLKDKQNTGHYVFIDEGGLTLDKFDMQLTWLGTTSRHWGHSVFFICQRIPQLNMTLRTQAECLFLFAVNREDSETLARDWNKDDLRQAPNLKRGEFLYLSDRFSPVRRGIVNLPPTGDGGFQIA